MKAINKAIIYIKAIAIFCVICAHCNSIGEHASSFAIASSRILQVIGTWGVGCFFFTSGALYEPKKALVGVVKDKFISLGIPWLISSTFIYLYVTLRKSAINVIDWLLYIVGYKTYCYYLTVLFAFFIIFYFGFVRKRISCIILLLLWLVSTSFLYHRHILTSYLDIFNWIGYFALGVLIRQNIELFERIIRMIIRYRWILYGLTVGLLILSVITGVTGYFGIKNICTVLFGCLAVIIVGTKLSFVYDIGVFKTIGHNTLFIYLWHMPIAGIVTKLLSNGNLSNIILLCPIIVYTIMCVSVIILQKIGQRFSLQKYMRYIGIST